MRKYFLSFFVIVAFTFYVMLNNQSSMDVAPGANGPIAINTGTSAGSVPKSSGSGGTVGGNGETPTPTPTPSTTPVPAPAPAPSGAYKNGSYTGPVTDAYYGPMQVEAVVTGGQLSDVKILQYPTSHSYSVQVNSYALPQLVQETIQAQSANVNIVSGATASSQAFQESLASALTQAKA